MTAPKKFPEMRCEVCGDLIFRRGRRRYCNGKCRQRAYDRKRKGAPREDWKQVDGRTKEEREKRGR